MLRRRRDPPAPRNVRVVFADGEQVPLELVYAGRSAEGIHVWRSVTPLRELPTQILADELPAQTAIEVAGT